MRTRRHRRLAAAAALVTATGLVATCGADAARMVGDAMVDAGGALVDAGMDLVGDAMVDAGGRMMDGGEDARDAAERLDGLVADAAAQPRPMEVLCDREYRGTTTFERTGAGGGRVTTVTTDTHWYAELDVAGLDPATVRDVHVVICDQITFEVPPPPAECPTGWVCTEDFEGEMNPSPLRCSQGGASYESGRIRVYCGMRREYRDERVTVAGADPAVTTFDIGSRWQRAYVTVEL